MNRACVHSNHLDFRVQCNKAQPIRSTISRCLFTINNHHFTTGFFLSLSLLATVPYRQHMAILFVSHKIVYGPQKDIITKSKQVPEQMREKKTCNRQRCTRMKLSNTSNFSRRSVVRDDFVSPLFQMIVGR